MVQNVSRYLLHLCWSLFVPAALASYQQQADGAVAGRPVNTFCVFDPVGKQGEGFQFMLDYRLAAMDWGAQLELKAYTDERIAAEDFKTGRCDGVSLTGIRGRYFNSFTGTMDSIGAIPSNDDLKLALRMLASPQMSRFMQENGYEVAGIIPSGNAYLFVNDRAIDSVEKMVGKRVAVLDYDQPQAVMAASIGANPVNASIATLGPMFNNGAVDVIAAPAIAYEPLELYRGLGDKGAIGRQAVGQLTFQLLIRPQHFPETFGQRSREYIFSQFDRVMDSIARHTRDIPDNRWLELSKADLAAYTEMFRQTRLMLRDEGYYNGSMLKFLSRVRCKLNPGLAECTAPDRE